MTCPVCGKGEHEEYQWPGAQRATSHLACAEKAHNRAVENGKEVCRMRTRTEQAKLETRIMQEKLAALSAENERLKCCGNCKWFRAEEYQNCGHHDVPTYEQGEYYISAPDKCDFAPNRWEARG